MHRLRLLVRKIVHLAPTVRRVSTARYASIGKVAFASGALAHLASGSDVAGRKFNNAPPNDIARYMWGKPDSMVASRASNSYYNHPRGRVYDRCVDQRDPLFSVSLASQKIRKAGETRE